jgi:ribonucleoside-diphosphate reductase alpha chain
MSIFDKATEVIVQGGDAAPTWAFLRCDHPDVIDFIEAKVGTNAFRNFNLSVGVTDAFLRAVANDRPFDLVDPRTGQSVRQLGARSVFDRIVNAAWRTGDPGLIFLDHVNRRNPTPAIGQIEATNPCGEVPLLPYESCILASINLDKMTKDKGTGETVGGAAVNWDKLRDRIHWGIRFRMT